MASQDKNRTDKLIGEQLGDYKLVERLAAGGMAKIYIGEDVKLGRKAAIKVLTDDMLEQDATLTERFQREARAVAALDHPNIVPIYQYGEYAELYFIAMKLIEGEDLADELNRHNREKKLIAVKRLMDIMEQVASALDYAHEQGIVHRDIKPSNVLLDRSGRAYLTDFGLVLRQQIDKTMGTAFGTPRYISPEQALASETSVPQSDIYSLAVIIYEALTGNMVFRADTAMQIALSHISEEPPPPRVINPAIPRAVEYELLKALKKDPEDRHPTAGNFIASIKDAYGNLLTDERAISPELLHSKTPPMRPAEMDKIIEEHVSSSTRETTDDTPTASIPSGKKTSPVAFVLMSMITMMVIVFAAWVNVGEGSNFISFGSSSDDGDQPASAATGEATDLPGAEAIAEPQFPASATLYYNDFAFALRNDSKETLDLSRVTIVRADGTDPLNPRDMPTQQLGQGECLSVTSNTSGNVEIDTNWKCEESSSGAHERQSADLFWRLTSESETFDVLVDDQVIATCDAIAAGRAGECAMKLPIVTEE